MPLPILKSSFAASAADLLRFAAQVNLEWTRHLADETPLDCGRAFAAPNFSTVYDANCILDATIPPQRTPESVYEQVEQHFAALGCKCAKWHLNHALMPEQSAQLSKFLISKSFQIESEQVRHLPHLPTLKVRQIPGLKIIPARASFRHYQALADEQAAHWNTPQWADAAMLHLDDSHYDALLAIKDGTAAGRVGVLAIGEVGAIQSLYVAQRFRRLGIGRTLMLRAIEISVRSIFRHILLTLHSQNTPAIALCDQLGFRSVGELSSYYAPSTASPNPQARL